MGIISQSALISTVAITPSGYLYARVPFIELFLLGSCSRIHSVLSPVAQAEFRTSAQQFVLHHQHIEEHSRTAHKLSIREALIVCYGKLVLPTSLIGQRLTGYIYQIVLKIIVATIFLSHAVQQSGIGRIVIVLHLRPAGCLEVVQRGSPAEDTLMRALLVVACRTVIYALS